MYQEIVSAVSSVKALSELLAAAKDLSNYNEIVLAVSQVNTKLMDATAVALSSQEKQAELAGKVRALEDKLREIQSWESMVARYKLHEFPTKTLAYILREDKAEGEPIHYICANCVDKRNKSTMQADFRFLKCPSCESKIAIEHQKPLQVNMSSRRGIF